MKFSIAQHEEMLKNVRRHYEEKRAAVNRMLEDCERSRQDLLKYEEKLAEAKRRKLDGFDSDKFMRKK